MNERVFRTDIEGLRGMAILLVVLFHAGVPGFAGAFVGVDVFFVLSGFFITGPLVQELANVGRIDFQAFYARRAQRTVPALLVVLLFSVTVMAWLNAPIDRAQIAATSIPVAFGAGNLAFASSTVNYFTSGDNPLLHTWSLGVEQQFYLVWPIVLLALFMLLSGRRDRPVAERLMRVLVGLAVLAFLSLSFSMWLTYASPAWAFFGTHARLWEFALGGMVAMIAGRTRSTGEEPADDTASTMRVGQRVALQLIGLAMIALAIALYDRGTPYPGIAALLPAIGAALLLMAGDAGAATPIGQALSSMPLQWFGRLSFAWYLWHWPLMELGSVLQRDITPLGRLAWAALGLPFAWLTLRYVEQPMRREQSRPGALRLGGRFTFTASVIACALFAVLAQAVRTSAARSARSPEQRRFLQARNDHLRHDCWASTVQGPTAPCVFGDATSDRTIVLLGDSHAEHWLAGFDRAGRENGWRIVAMVRGGCPVADMSGLANRNLERRYRECAEYRAGTLRRIVAMRPTAVVLSSFDHYIPFDVPVPGGELHEKVAVDEWTRGLRSTYATLANAGIDAIVLRGTPRTWFDVPSCLSRRAAGLPFAAPCTFARERGWSQAGIDSQNDAARGLDIRFLDMNDQICQGAVCSVEQGGVIRFTDDNHLTASFTRSLAPELGRRVARLLPPRGNDGADVRALIIARRTTALR